jgi:topoisomerase-4 subunit B
LGEISPDEFSGFIGKNIRLEPVLISQDETIHKMLDYYMGKNSPERQDFIIGKLRVERSVIEEEII